LTRYYEGMFLFDPAVAASWENAQQELSRIMDRAGARMIASGKWDERRLAYEISGRKRGLYALTYFEAEATKIGDMERDVRLSESILRCLVIRVDHLTEDEMKDLAARPNHASAGEGDGPPPRTESRRPTKETEAVLEPSADVELDEAPDEADVPEDSE